MSLKKLGFWLCSQLLGLALLQALRCCCGKKDAVKKKNPTTKKVRRKNLKHVQQKKNQRCPDPEADHKGDEFAWHQAREKIRESFGRIRSGIQDAEAALLAGEIERAQDFYRNAEDTFYNISVEDLRAAQATDRKDSLGTELPRPPGQNHKSKPGR